ncbi:unnamed protein product [Rotaria sordida]|uniref:Uncharacterized protein n=1 Tax=Rotaria sordida TaxID=392033 RepID=A0A813TJQ6_9BILA|nr:unnamed protein product [Rotaria sordida]
MKRLCLFITTLIIGILAHFSHANDFNLRNIFSKTVKTYEDQNILTQLEQRLPNFLDINIPANENLEKVFLKFKEAIRLIPANIQRHTPLDGSSARAIFPAMQPIYRYVKDSVWKSILKLIDLPKELLRIPAQNLPDTNLNNLLSYSDENTVSQVLEFNSNRQDFSDEQKTILVQNYIDKIKNKLNPNNFQQLITQKLGASFLRYLPLNFLLKNPIFNDNSVIRNVATWLHYLSPLQRDAISNKIYRSLTDTSGKTVQNNNPLRLTADDPSTLDMIIRMMPSLSTRQIINAIGDKIDLLLERSSLREDQSCTISLALLNRTLEAKRSTNRDLRPNPKLLQRWQECYSGCDLTDLLTNPQDLKELLKSHPSPESCERLIYQVKKEYNLDDNITVDKLREVSDALGSIYRTDEIINLSDELMAELGRDEKTLERLGAQDLTPNEARSIITKIPRSTQNLWGKSVLGKLGNLIPGMDNTILKQILTRGRSELPPLFNNTSPSFIRKLVPSKIRLLIDQYSTEQNLAKYRQLLDSDYAKKFIKSDTLTQILQLLPDTLRLIRFTPAQAAAAITKRLGLDRKFDGSLGHLAMLSNFINGLTKNDIEKIKPEESLQAIQQVFGNSRSRNIDNQMQSNTRYAFGNVLRRGLQMNEGTQRVDDYIKGLFRENNLVDDLNPQLFSTMTNAELDAINRLNYDEADRFWNAIGSIREPTCCSFVNENRFRLADYALKHYGSATGDIDNFKLAQLGPFLATSLRASDIRRIKTDALINKIKFFKSACFQPSQSEAQALGARLNDALGEVDDNLKALYLDLIGELIIFLPKNIAAPQSLLSQRTHYLSKSLDKIHTRDEKCIISDQDEFLSRSEQGIKRTLVNAFLRQHLSSDHSRERRQTNQNHNNNEITCRELRQMGSAVSALSTDEISSITDDTVYRCVDTFGSTNDYEPEKQQQIAEKYIRALQNEGRHIQSLTQPELYRLNSILPGFTPSELLQLRNEHFRDGNFLSSIGNLDGWTKDQLKSLSRLALGREQRLTPSIIENAGKILCTVDEQLLRRIPPEDVKSYLTILSNIQCPKGADMKYASIMYDVVKNAYEGDLLRPDIFGSLGTIAAGLKFTDLGKLTSRLFNFFPKQAFSTLPKEMFKSFTNDQLQNLNIEQIRSIPTDLLYTLSGKQIAIVNQILYPFKTSEEPINFIQKSTSNDDVLIESEAMNNNDEESFRMESRQIEEEEEEEEENDQFTNLQNDNSDEEIENVRRKFSPCESCGLLRRPCCFPNLCRHRPGKISECFKV